MAGREHGVLRLFCGFKPCRSYSYRSLEWSASGARATWIQRESHPQHDLLWESLCQQVDNIFHIGRNLNQSVPSRFLLSVPTAAEYWLERTERIFKHSSTSGVIMQSAPRLRRARSRCSRNYRRWSSRRKKYRSPSGLCYYTFVSPV